ncbi:36354_t:CDS:2 [Gigaspora margarita]|uniref:36354_t:CDS:1 n=1 Tax=Gigaspora margarita TaxID=4874 RepID=A0ABN7USC4_GIGMA|nr:36354_t:CDS:2 [Gigaspora margarita]
MNNFTEMVLSKGLRDVVHQLNRSFDGVGIKLEKLVKLFSPASLV